MWLAGTLPFSWKQINKLNNEKKKLLSVNGNLLQKISVEKEEALDPKPKEKNESIEDIKKLLAE